MVVMAYRRHSNLRSLIFFSVVTACTCSPTLMLAADKQPDQFRQIAYEIIKGVDRSGAPPEKTNKLDKALRYLRKV